MEPSARGPAEYFTGTGASLSSSRPRPDADRHRRLRLCAELGGPIKVIRPGDLVWCPPGEKHWHGAMPGTAMEKVTDDQYNAAQEER
jgi:hypothetical protein